MKKILLGFLALLIATVASADPIITGSKPYTFTPGTTISSSQVNANFDYIINQTNTNAAKNGVNTSITALLGLTTPLNPASGGSPIFYAASVGGTGDAVTISSTVPAISSFSLTAGTIVVFTPTANNTISAPTLNVNGTGAIAIRKNAFNPIGLLNLRPGDLNIGQTVMVVYNGTNFIHVTPPTHFGQATNIASAATTDLGTVGSHFAVVTGTTTITSFGSTANEAQPIYLVRFVDNLTITYNATSMITPSGGDISSTAGGLIIAESLGSGNWRINAFIPAINTSDIESVNGLVIQNNAGTPNTQVDVAKTKAILCNTTDFCVRTGSTTITINGAVNGANGLDTGSLANNTWYYIYIIHTGSAAAGLLSTSATTPTMPAGYTFKYRVGAIRTGGAATFNRIIQRGNKARYVVVTGSVTPNLPIIIADTTAGNLNTPTWVSLAVANVSVPTTATEIHFTTASNSSSGFQGIMIAPNNNYGAFSSLTNPPPYIAGMQNDGGRHNIPGSIVLESANIFYAQQGFATACVGWTDAVNAN